MNRILLLGISLCFLASCRAQPATTPDAIATGVAIQQAISLTLTAQVPSPSPSRGATATPPPNAVATGVSIQRAIAATLTAEIPTATRTPTPNPTQPVDSIATGVIVQKAIASTLTAQSPTGRPAELASPAPSPSPTSPQPTPALPPTPPPSATAADCVSWHQANDYVGAHQCICGIVTGTYHDPGSSAFFVNFDTDRSGYYAVSFNHTFQGVEGACVRICGIVEVYKGRPQTIINSPDQFQELQVCP